MSFTESQLRELREVITYAFTRDELEQRIRFDLNLNIDEITSPSLSFPTIVFKVVQYAERAGLLDDLVQAVAKAHPANSRVRAMLEHLGVIAETDNLERIVRSVTPFTDPALWRTRLSGLERRVCRVEIEAQDGSAQAYGTGFLVGPDSVMTAYHVIAAQVTTSGNRTGSVQFRFDYKTGPDGFVLNAGTVFRPAATDWLVAWSPFQENEGLDYAIVRLDQPIEPDRGYVPLPTTRPVVTPGMPLFIMQYPKSGPLKLAFETNGVIESSLDRRFMFHRVNTEAGSSGSPVFNADWELIGLHQRGEEDRKTAVAMAAIVEDFQYKKPDIDADGEHGSAQPSSDASTFDEITQRLRDYQPLVGAQAPPDEPPALDAYRKAAAVLVSFDIGNLQPLPPAEADELALVRLISECSFRTDTERGPRYVLNSDVRQAAIAKMSACDLRRALKLNREFPEDLPQRMFSALILDEPLPEIGTDPQRLRDLLHAVTALRGKVHAMPDETRLRQRIARVELLAPHRHLVGRNFRGRDYELFRLSALLDGDRAKPLLVQGIGGSGKSALIGRFLLDRHQGNGPWAPFVFLDFDRSMLAAEEPITLMTEAVRQLGAQFPELTGVATRLITSWEKKLDRARAPQPGQTRSSVPRGLARYSLDETDRAEIRCEALRFLRRLLLPGDRLLLVLDTFEEVQIRSSDAVDSFWKFLDELLDDVPGLRIVVSGRAELKDRHVQELPLGDLEPKAAVEVVVAGGVPSDVAAKVVELVGGNPLCLQLALQVLHREGLEALDGLAASDLAVAGAIRSEIVERWLYRRILGHVHDKEVAKLAWPGLAVRLIDPQVIREVLAEPCGLHVPDDAVAHDLFERLSSEVTLVQQRRVGTLYHRPDVRRLMLAQLRTDALDQFDAINRKAAEFYRAKTAGQTTIDLEARAEEIYHRLALGEPLGTVEPLWVDGVEEFLYNAVEDFTAVEPATFLASRLHVELPQDLWDQARIEDWELQAARRAQDLLALNEPTKALAVLTSRPERSSGSPLYLLEARLRLQQGEDDAAIHLARAAIHKAAAANKDSTCLDLLLFLGDALWRRGDLNAARVSLGEAIAVAKRLPDPRHAIDALMQYLRLGRMRNYGGVPSADDAAWRAELGMRLKRLTRSALYSVPVLMQQAAAEASSEDAEAFRFVAQVVGSRIKEALVLYPRVAPPDRLRVWLGAWAATAAPTLNWFLNGAPVIPTELRSLASVRPDAMLPPGVAPEELQRAFAGVYEFAGLIPDTLYTIAVQTDNQSATLKTRTLPSAVPTGLDRWLNVLLVSCFHQAENHQGLAGTIVSQLPAVAKPHLTVLAGDQVSLDLPTLKDFPDDLAWLAEKFEKDYTLNWRGPRGYAEILRAAPSLAIPGDHEYWNNFPHPSPFIGNSLTPDGRNRWREAAQAMYAGFQLPYPAQMGEPVRFEVEPLSFFVADTRSHRDAERCFTMSDEAHHRMEQWVSDTIAKKQFGVFVSGQSLFTKATSKIAGGAGDYKLPNYGDYGRILLCLRRLADAGRPTLCLTGDMPLGRVLRAMDIRTGRTAYTEIIASPVSLVPTPGQDPIREVGAFSSGLCGSNNPWPPHFDPDDPPAFLASEVLQRRFPCATQHQQKGNHVVLLSFRQHGSGIEVRIKYWPITRNALVAQASEIGPITLLGA